MLYYKKIIALFLTFAIILSFMVVPASASVGEVLYRATMGNIHDFMSSMWQDAYESLKMHQEARHAGIREFYDFWHGMIQDHKFDYLEFLDALQNGDYGGGEGCTSVKHTDLGLLLRFELSNEDREEYQELYSNGELVSLSYNDGCLEYELGSYNRSKIFYDESTYYWDQPAVTFYTSEFTLSKSGTYEITVDPIYTLGRTKYSKGSDFAFDILKYVDGEWICSASYKFTSTSDPSSNPNGTLYTMTPDSSNLSVSLADGYKYKLAFDFSQDSVASSAPGYYIGFDRYIDCGYVNLVLTSEETVVPAVTRPVHWFNTFNDYNNYVSNTSNNYTNYVIGTADANGNVVEVYDFDIFDESTMIIQNPASGDTWTATAWEYDYLTRSYYCTLENGQYVRITYGDECVTIIYPGTDDVYHQQDYYYVTATYNQELPSTGDCNHEYTDEIVTAPTCTTGGWRKYTCSICEYTYQANVPATGHAWEPTEIVDPEFDANGNVTQKGYTEYTCSVCGETYREETTQQEHAYTYEITQPPDCNTPGMGLYTCKFCGDQYTEHIPALGHDWLPTSITDESWAMPDGVSCPDCRGTSFSHTRSDYELVTGGKNLLNLDLDVFNTLSTWGVGYNKSRLFSEAVSKIPFKPNTQYTVSWNSSLAEGSDGVVYLRFYYSGGGVSSYNLHEIVDARNFGNDDKYSDGYRSVTSLPGDSVVGMSIDPATGGFYSLDWIQVEEGPVATEYEPFIPHEVEIIPPIYHFTCDDCSNTWDAEAIYKHAYTTFTCSRCDETMIQSNEPPMEEQDWFTNFGDALKDFGSNVFKALGNGITKILSGFVSMISGIFGFLSDIVFDGVGDFFSGLSDSSITDFFQQENSDGSTTTMLPGEMAAGMSRITAFFTGLPADLKGVLTFGIGLMFLLAALKLML